MSEIFYTEPQLVIETGGHGGPVQAMECDRAGDLLVTGSPDKSVRLWSARDGRLIRQWLMPSGPGETGAVSVVAISPDGRFVVAGGWISPIEEGERLFVFDTASGAVRHIIGDMPNIPQRIAMSPDGRSVAVGFDAPHGVLMVDIVTGTLLWHLKLPINAISGLGFRPSGNLMVTSWDGLVFQCDPAGQVVESEPRQAAPPKKVVGYLAVADDQTLAVAYPFASQVDVWTGGRWVSLPILDRESGGVGRLVWLRDGRLASGNRTSDQRDENFVRICPQDVTRAANGQSLLGRIFLRGQKPLDLPIAAEAVHSLASLADGGVAIGLGNGDLIAYHGDGRLLWRAPSGRLPRARGTRLLASAEGGRRLRLQAMDRQIGAVMFDLAALRLVPASEPVDWRQSPAVPMQELAELVPPRLRDEDITCVIAGPARDGGKELVYGSNVGITVWEPTRRPRWKIEHAAKVLDLTLSADDRWLIADHEDGIVRWYDYRDGRLALSLFLAADGRRWVAWTPDGAYACVAGAEEMIRHLVPHGRDAPGEWQAPPLPARPDVIAQALG